MDYQEIQTKNTETMQQDRFLPAEPETIRKQPPNNMATASLVLGIIALVTFCCYYTALPLGGLGILFGLLSRPEGKFTGHARAGMIMSAIAIVLTVLFWGILIAVAFSEMGNTDIQNMPMIAPVPEGAPGLDNVLTFLPWLLTGGGR